MYHKICAASLECLINNRFSVRLQYYDDCFCFREASELPIMANTRNVVCVIFHGVFLTPTQHAKLITIVGNAACIMQLMTCSSLSLSLCLGVYLSVCACVSVLVFLACSDQSRVYGEKIDLRSRVEVCKALEQFREWQTKRGREKETERGRLLWLNCVNLILATRIMGQVEMFTINFNTWAAT